jgi:hypothetical protein
VSLFSLNVLIVGIGALAFDIVKEITDVKKIVNKIKGFVGREKPVYNPCRAPVCLEFEAFDELLDNREIVRIIVSLDDSRGVWLGPSLLQCKLRRLPIEQGLMFKEGSLKRDWLKKSRNK